LLVACSKGSTPDIAPIALTPVEYNNTIRDLLGMPDSGGDWPAAPEVAMRLSPPTGQVTDVFGLSSSAKSWPWELPDEAGVDAFEGMVDGQDASPYQLEELQKAAMFFGAHTLVSPTFSVCDELENCGWESIERFAQRAWRRPITEAETRRLRTFWDDQLAQGQFDEAVALTAAGILQSPHFVFRMEQGRETDREKGRVKLTDYEIASKLSYFLWDSMPDTELFAAAEKGKLSSKGGMKKQVERMLQDPRAVDAVVHFHNQWLGTDQVRNIAPARSTFGPLYYDLDPYSPLDTTGDEIWPSVLGPVRASMEAETHLFIAKTVFEGGGTLEALFTDNHGYLSYATEPLYGDVEALEAPTVDWEYTFIAASGGTTATLQMRPVTFNASERAGLLTLPSVLAIGSHPVHPSPILRGVRILERVTCTELGTPPPGAEGQRPPDTAEAEATNRVRTENVTGEMPCSGCHDIINPVGFAFENYDAMGGYRARDNGQDVDASGVLELGDVRLKFNDGVDLSRQLSELPLVQDCYAQRWTDYAMGTHIDPTDPDMSRLLADFRANDDVPHLLERIATSEFFRFRAIGGE
jgi:hypothetical protein